MKKGIDYYTDISDNYMTDDEYRLRYHKNRFSTFNSLILREPGNIFEFGYFSTTNRILIVGSDGRGGYSKNSTSAIAALSLLPAVVVTDTQ